MSFYISTVGGRDPRLDTHRTSIPIDHPDASIPVTKLAFRTFREIYRTSWGSPWSAEVVNIAITGLSINNDKIYILRVTQAGTPYANDWLLGKLFINNDQTPTNYYSQYILVDGTTVSAGRDNDAWVLFEPVNNIPGSAIIYIFRDVLGYARAISISSVNVGGSVKIQIRSLIYVNPVTDITQINYYSVRYSRGELILYGGVT